MANLSAGVLADDTLMITQGGGFRLTNPNREDKNIYWIFHLSIILLKEKKEMKQLRPIVPFIALEEKYDEFLEKLKKKLE